MFLQHVLFWKADAAIDTRIKTAIASIDIPFHDKTYFHCFTQKISNEEIIIKMISILEER